MIYRNLGNTSVKISTIGLGTTGTGGRSSMDAQRTERLMKLYRYAVDLGVNYFDTAELYGGGYAEEVLGKALKPIRDAVLIGSKFNPQNNSFDGVMRSVEGTLRRLDTDYLDLYQVHWPNPLIPLSETMRAMEKLVDQGKIRYIGVSNFCLEELEEAQTFLDRGQVVSIQAEYSLLDRAIEQEIIPYCASNNITILVYGALNHGRVAWHKEQEEVLSATSERYGRIPSQVVLGWILSQPSVVALTKTSSFEHLRQNVLSTEFMLEKSDVELISSAFNDRCILVPLEQIRLTGANFKATYNSVQEAVENKLDLIPSPLILAKNILARKAFKPIRLVPTRDQTGKYSYDLDAYDLMGEVKKYWAWVIAYGAVVPIPAYCMPDDSIDSVGTTGKLAYA